MITFGENREHEENCTCCDAGCSDCRCICNHKNEEEDKENLANYRKQYEEVKRKYE